MTTGLAELATRADDTIVCFDRHGVERSRRELVAAAAAVEAALSEREGERWALNFGDVYAFAAALLGCWAAGRTAVVAPATLLSTAGLVAIDGVIEAASEAAIAPQRIVLDELTPVARRLGPIRASAPIVLYTSGSTGVPKEVRRQLDNMEHELVAFESTWGRGLGACRVYSTVSHRHVYGLLFRVLWPLRSQRPFATFDLEYPEQLLGPASDGQILVSSPALLKRIGHLKAGEAHWRAVFSSGGVLPGEAGADATRVLGVAPIEVLGSTETSGVGWRRVGTPRFAAFPSVELRTSPEELLEVRSPFSGASDWLRMGDRVHLHDDGGIELLGRADRIAKIEDKRISLQEIEAHLGKHPWVKDSAAVALDRGGRQHIGAVIELSELGREALAERGRAALSRELRAALRGKIDAVGVPRVFRYRDGIPVDAQGKRQVAALAALFVSVTTTEPVVEASRVDGADAELTLVVPTDLEYLEGHFEGAPIVAGVVQVKWAIDLAGRYLKVAGRFAGFEALKFQQVMQPQQSVVLTLRWVAADGKLHFSYKSGDLRFGSGRILLRAP